MEEPLSQETTLPNGEKTVAPCKECDRATRHHILTVTKSHFRSPDGEIDVWIEDQIIQCQGCLMVSFCKDVRCSEEHRHDELGYIELIPTKTYFPSRIAGRSEMRGAYHLPSGVYAIYAEAHAAICSELTIMAGFGIRAIIEAVCKEQSMAGKNL